MWYVCYLVYNKISNFIPKEIKIIPAKAYQMAFIKKSKIYEKKYKKNFFFLKKIQKKKIYNKSNILVVLYYIYLRVF